MSYPEHSEDKADRLRAIAQAKKFGPEIVENYKILSKLILTYSDGEAERLLNKLREQFWGIDLPNTVEHEQDLIKEWTEPVQFAKGK